jgi:5-methylcytosine-specific restriction protein A
MQNSKSEKINTMFYEYLIKQGLSESTASGQRSTTYDYAQRVERICKEENITWSELTENVNDLINLYDKGGSKQLEGQKSNRAPINALKKFSSFCNSVDLDFTNIGDKLLIVDLFSGTYNNHHKGHELFNDKPNPLDGYYYGYVPDYDNPNIDKLGASKTDDFVDDVLIVFVSKISESNKNRIITGFYPRAKVYRKGKSKYVPNRTFKDKDGSKKEATYSLFSKSYVPVDANDSFIIEISKYSSHMFRKQRVYQDTYPELDEKVLDFISNYQPTEIEDDTIYQKQIEKSDELSDEKAVSARDRDLELQDNQSSKIIKRDPRLAKTAIIKAGYKCQVDENHQTFQKTNGKQYMEGHHLIPCTYKNALYFKEKYDINIDCMENIVSICPNCHRAIHYGDENTKFSILETLFNIKQKTYNEKLKLNLSFDDIKKYYV